MEGGYEWMAFGDPPEVIPLNDLKPHVIGWGCWCHPKDDEGCIVHNSMDRRELYEDGKQKPS